MRLFVLRYRVFTDDPPPRVPEAYSYSRWAHVVAADEAAAIEWLASDLSDGALAPNSCVAKEMDPQQRAVHYPALDPSAMTVPTLLWAGPRMWLTRE